MKILELFSGYGTASFALKRLGIEHEIVGYSDIDKYANQCFQQNHGGKELGDVKKIDPETLPDFDLLTGGFPCQAFSNAGKMQGELEPRGTLFYEIIRIAEVKQPKYMLLENVKGLTCKKFKDTFSKILSELDRIGYNVYWKVLNSKDYGIPQSRARVWFVCFRKDIDTKTFKFPEPVELKIFVKDLLEENVDEKYILNQKEQDWVLDSMRQKKKYTSLSDKIAITLTRRQYASWNGNYVIVNLQPRNGKGQGGKGIILKEDGAAYCIDTANSQAVCHGGSIRRLTPKECFRLMGFLNDEINLEGLSDTQIYKLAGNGQDVNMVSLIFQEMFK